MIEKRIAGVLLSGAAFLLVEVRFEHREVLGETWRGWIPLTCAALLLAAQVRAGYRHVFGAYSSADYVPIGVDLLASTGTMDFIISAEMPRKLQAASNIYEGRVQLQARF